MGRGISGETQIELLRLLRERYKGSSKSDKTKILDEFVAVSGFHRKHAIRKSIDRIAANRAIIIS